MVFGTFLLTVFGTLFNIVVSGSVLRKIMKRQKSHKIAMIKEDRRDAYSLPPASHRPINTVQDAMINFDEPPAKKPRRVRRNETNRSETQVSELQRLDTERNATPRKPRP